MRFRTLVIDPPWDYKGPGAFKTSNRGRYPEIGASARARYALMTTDDLAALPVADAAEPDAHLYLWTTNQFLVDGSASRLCAAWGFRAITLLTWAKTKRDGSVNEGGTGYYWRNCTEHMLFAVRGSLRTDQSRVRPTCYLWPRTPHSVKPEQSYRLVEEASPGPYLELFARRSRPGWVCLGNGIDGRDIRESLPDLARSSGLAAAA